MTEPWDGDLTGEVVAGRYVIGSLIGTGGMAEVYRAYDRQMNRAVAVKAFVGTASQEDSVRLEREARVLSSLRCRGVVTVFDIGTHKRRPYYVMQEIGGGTLRQRMADPLPPAFVARVGGQVAETLAHVHSLGIVHRDIKPSNILLCDTEKQAYVADFGLALQAHVTRMTKSGVLVGTAGYLAPEQVRGSSVGPQADIYSLGLVLLECMTGRPEYPGGDAEAALARLSRLPRIPPMLPAEWISLLTAMTHVDPARRPAASRCAASLLAAQEASRGVPALLSADPVDPPPRRSRRFGYALSAAAAAAVAAVAVTVSNISGVVAPATGEPSAPPGAPVITTVPPTQQTVSVTPSTVTVVKQKPSREVKPDRTKHPKRSKPSGEREEAG